MEKIKSDPYAIENKYLDNRFNYLTEELIQAFLATLSTTGTRRTRLRDLDLKTLEAKYSSKSPEELLYLDNLWFDEPTI